MYEEFTERGQKVMALANQGAMLLNHDYLGSEHILLGLLDEGTSTSANLLMDLGVDIPKVRMEVEKLVGKSIGEITSGNLPPTLHARQVIAYATEEARRLNHSHLETEHLLLGLLREKACMGNRVLINLGVNLKVVREEVMKGLKPGNTTINALHHLPMFRRWLDDPTDPVAKLLTEIGVDLIDFRRRINRAMDDNLGPQ